MAQIYGAYHIDCWEGGYEAFFDSYDKAYQFCRIQAKRHNKWQRRYNKRKNKQYIITLFEQHFFSTDDQGINYSVRTIQVY